MNHFETAKPVTHEELEAALKRGRELRDKEIALKLSNLLRRITNIFRRRNKVIPHKPAGARA